MLYKQFYQDPDSSMHPITVLCLKHQTSPRICITGLVPLSKDRYARICLPQEFVLSSGVLATLCCVAVSICQRSLPGER